MVTLDSLDPDQSGIIESVKATGEIRRRLLDMGLIKGVLFTVVRVAPLGDPIVILLKGFQLSLRKEEARQIGVTRTENGVNKRSSKRNGLFGIFGKKGGDNE